MGIIPVTNMNKLPLEKQILILSHLVEGNSIRSTERLTGVHRDTIMRLLISAGDQASLIMDKYCRNLSSNFIQCDEIWTYVSKKQGTLRRMGQRTDDGNPIGDQWIFVALDAETKLVPTFAVGKRSLDVADILMSELHSRIVTRFQLSTDAWKMYRLSVMKYFGSESISYGQVIKSFGNDRFQEQRYSPSRVTSVTLRPIFGNPNITQISTSFIERQNLTIRMQNRRLTRLTNAYSKKVENLKAAMALHFFHYNFIRPHSSLNGTTPAMAARIARSFWKWEQLVAA